MNEIKMSQLKGAVVRPGGFMRKELGKPVIDAGTETNTVHVPRGPIARLAFTRLQQAFLRFSISPQKESGHVSPQDYARLAKNLTEVLRKVPAEDLQHILNMPDTNAHLAKACELLDRVGPGAGDGKIVRELLKVTVELLRSVVKKFDQYFRSEPGRSIPVQRLGSTNRELRGTLKADGKTGRTPRATLSINDLEADLDEPKTRWVRE